VPAGFSIKTPACPPRGHGGAAGWRAYNPFMIDAFNAGLGGAAVERMTLLINHVLGGEAVATQRLLPHAGRCIGLHFEGWPRALPPLPALVFRVTPAGLVEWCGTEPPPEPDLRVRIDASNPALAIAQALAGTRPKIEVAGDAAFAADLNWLFDNLRWDVQDDLAKIVGPAPAREIARIAGGIAAALREAVRTLTGLVTRDATAPAGPPPR
jgi:ubiquinone biosynthesis accessory factor UbiJ